MITLNTTRSTGQFYRRVDYTCPCKIVHSSEYANDVGVCVCTCVRNTSVFCVLENKVTPGFMKNNSSFNTRGEIKLVVSVIGENTIMCSIM